MPALGVARWIDGGAARLRRSRSAAVVELVGQPAEQGVDLCHPVATDGHRQAKSTQLGDAEATRRERERRRIRRLVLQTAGATDHQRPGQREDQSTEQDLGGEHHASIVPPARTSRPAVRSRPVNPC